MELESLPVRRAGSYVTLQTALFWEKQTVPRLVLNFLRHILNSFLAAQHSPLKAASRTELKTGKVNGGEGKGREKGNSVILAGTCCSGSQAAAPIQAVEGAHCGVERIEEWHLSAHSRIQPLYFLYPPQHLHTLTTRTINMYMALRNDILLWRKIFFQFSLVMIQFLLSSIQETF